MTNVAFFPRQSRLRRRTARPRRARAAGFGAPSTGILGADHRPKILLAFSGPVQREYLTAALASRGYEVHPCDTGSGALSRLSTRYYDAVVTGIVMPQGDGLELLRELRRRRDGVPVVAVTEGSDQIDLVYQRCATLAGAIAAHTLGETWGPLLRSLEWIIRGQGRCDPRDSVVT